MNVAAALPRHTHPAAPTRAEASSDGGARSPGPPGPTPPSDGELVRRVWAGEPSAQVVFFDRFAPLSLRVLRRILGGDQEIPDLLQEVFVRVFERIESLREPDKARAFVLSVTVFVARERIRSKQRWSWIRLGRVAEVDPPMARATDGDDEAAEALRVTYRILDRLGEEERTVFVLRFLEGLELTAISEACGLSLATAKRRLHQAGERFRALASREPALASWLTEGGRWTPA
jgi:RNA polymerase sigma-70 factor, ECF subfamily